MKRILFVALLLLSAHSMWAQEVYHVLSEDHKTWLYQCYYAPDGEYDYTFFTDGDTIIGTRKGFRLYRGDHGQVEYQGAIYDDGKKTMLIKPNTQEPVLLYDFELKTDDVLDGYDAKVVGEDTIEVDAHRFRVLSVLFRDSEGTTDDDPYVTSEGMLIEGIGSSSKNFVHPIYWSVFDVMRFTACFVDGQLIYHTNLYVPTAVNSFTRDASENPSPIYDLQGRKVSEKGEVTNGQLPRGVYIRDGRKFIVK